MVTPSELAKALGNMSTRSVRLNASEKNATCRISEFRARSATMSERSHTTTFNNIRATPCPEYENMRRFKAAEIGSGAERFSQPRTTHSLSTVSTAEPIATLAATPSSSQPIHRLNRVIPTVSPPPISAGLVLRFITSAALFACEGIYPIMRGAMFITSSAAITWYPGSPSHKMSPAPTAVTATASTTCSLTAKL